MVTIYLLYSLKNLKYVILAFLLLKMIVDESLFADLLHVLNFVRLFLFFLLHKNEY